MIFEPQSGFLRYVKLGEREVVRGLYAAVRDRNWGTIAPQVSNLQTHIKERSFHLQFDVTHREDEIHFAWRGELIGQVDSTIIYRFDGIAKSTFKSNRIGLCVLHPMKECAGQSCEILHTDGSLENSAFPDYIAPHQPFCDVRAITHEASPGVRATVRCEGDTFETEDQRNWTDASFKTYNRPLALPFPFEIKCGTRIEQSITISLDVTNENVGARRAVPALDRARHVPNNEIVISIDQTQAIPLPPIGLVMASHNIPLNETEIARLKVLSPAHLRVDIKLDEEYESVWRRASEEAFQLETQLEVALFVSDTAENQLSQFVKFVGEEPPVTRWMIFHCDEKVTSQTWIELARKNLKHISSAPIGSGTNAYFTELNREHPPLDAVDFVTYSVNPQVHAFDDLSLIETLPAQAQTVRSAQQFAPGKPIIVSPITLRPRYNADATGEANSSTSGELPRNVDTRQLSLLGAGWTLGSIKHLAQGNVASLTYYETTGWRGVLETEEGSPLPNLFPSRPGAVFPLYHVFADIAEFAGGKVLFSRSSEPLKVESLVLQRGDKSTFMLANFTAISQKVRIKDVSGQVRLLSKHNIEQVLREPERWRSKMTDTFSEIIELPPYGFARIDKENK